MTGNPARAGSSAEFFRHATEFDPYPWVERLAAVPVAEWPELLVVPTGAGKTAGVTIPWLWQREVAPEITPRRLVWCLPMRSLVEQTADAVAGWLANLGVDAEIRVHRLLGGDIDLEWHGRPELPAVLIGTQDQILSRQLNRGYAESRFRWPMSFGLLNSDVLVVCDEVQLMGPGLATSRQLDAFRACFGVFGQPRRTRPWPSSWPSMGRHPPSFSSTHASVRLNAPATSTEPWPPSTLPGQA